MTKLISRLAWLTLLVIFLCFARGCRGDDNGDEETEEGEDTMQECIMEQFKRSIPDVKGDAKAAAVHAVRCMDVTTELVAAHTVVATPSESGSEAEKLQSVANTCGAFCAAHHQHIWQTYFSFNFSSRNCSCFDSQFVPANSSIMNISVNTSLTKSITMCSSAKDKSLVFSMDVFCAPGGATSSGVCSDGCARVGACCGPPSTSSGDNMYNQVAMWLAISIAFLLLLEAAQLITRKILRRRQQSDTPVSLRDRSEAESLSSALMHGMQVVKTGDGSENDTHDPNDVCPICLEPYGSSDIAVLPCQHAIHQRCLHQLITFGLRRYSDLLCPVCRAPLLGGEHDHPPVTSPLLATPELQR